MKKLVIVLSLAACGQSEAPKASVSEVVAPGDAEVAVARDAAPADARPTIAVEAFPGFAAEAVGQPSENAAATLVPVKAIAPGCAEDPDAAVALALAADVDAARPGAEHVIVTLAHGVVAFDAGRPLATTAEPLTRCGGSQTSLDGAWAGQVVPDPEAELVVVETSGGKNISATTLHVLKRRADRFVPILTHTLRETEAGAESTSALGLTTDGVSVTRDGAATTLRWDPAAFAYR